MRIPAPPRAADLSLLWLCAALDRGWLAPVAEDVKLEADSVGVVIAARAGHDPYGLVSALQTLQGISADDSGMALFLKTHPSPTERLAALERDLRLWF